MRLLLLPLLALALLPGCATKGYLLDASVPAKTAVVASELQRYGLDARQTQCVGGRLAADLSVWELRQLRDALAALRSGGGGGGLDSSRLWQLVPQIRDPEVSRDVTSALTACAISASPPPPPAVPAPAVPSEAPRPADPAPSPATADKAKNGPANYEPSANLLLALEAYERRDFPSAVRLAKIAADAGDSGAQQFLGGLYASGQGVRADVPAAVRYYAMAAEQGWSEAMNNLAKAYETGLGIGRDHVQALKWYLLASARATEDEQLVAKNMQNLVRIMSLADIEKAGALAREWERSRRQ